MYITNFKMYKTCSNKKYKNCIYMEKINPFLKQNHTIFKNIDIKFIEYINTFLNTLQKENPNIDLNLFYANLNSLLIKERNNFNRFIFFKTYIRGLYKYKENKIIILKNDYKFTIFHELLHCASAKKTENCFSSGFFKKYSKTSVGGALNEGYTSLLEERYFKNNFKDNSYIHIKFISNLIELLIGKDKMEKFYFTSDLNSVIKEFEKYGVNKKQVIFFLDELDYIKCNLGFDDNKYYCQQAIYSITNFLINCYKHKDPSKLNEYMNNFKVEITANNITYNFLENEWDMYYTKYNLKEFYTAEINSFKKQFIK